MIQKTADDYLWPMIQEKLNVLNKAGLSKDNFSDVDATVMKDPKQRLMWSYLQEIANDNMDDEMMRAAEEAESQEYEPEEKKLRLL